MYQALYRKWRPKAFCEVSGQPHVTLTLLNELKSGRISHAYLFTGSRGTGKTSCAKILSKAVNCLNPVNGEPCGECEICKGIDSGSILDVIEIDAASNNGVDNIRDIREEVNLTPYRCKYRVYIIDEVHMLSTGAFNALLKTLEEPPAHVIFILATTEVHKLPATVLSRCQRFDFKRISPEEIAKRLIHIAEGEGVNITEDAALLIARLADGGMRDAVSLLDRCCARGENIDSEVVSSSAGIAGTAHLFEFSDYISKGDCAACITLVNRLHTEACDIESLCSELNVHFRNLMISKTVKDCSSLIICPKDELEALRERAKVFRLSAILSCLDIIEEAQKQMKGSSNKKIVLESAVIRMCGINTSKTAEALPSTAENAGSEIINSLLSRIETLENIIKNGNAPAPSPSEPVKPAEPAAKEEKKPVIPTIINEQKPEPKPEQKQETEQKPPEIKNPEPEKQFSPSNKPEEPQQPENVPDNREFTAWPEVLDNLKTQDMPLYYLLIDSTAYVNKGTHLVICSENAQLDRFIRTESHAYELRKSVFNVTGEKLKLAIKQSSPVTGFKKNPLEDLKSKINDFNNK